MHIKGRAELAPPGVISQIEDLKRRRSEKHEVEIRRINKALAWQREHPLLFQARIERREEEIELHQAEMKWIDEQIADLEKLLPASDRPTMAARSLRR